MSGLLKFMGSITAIFAAVIFAVIPPVEGATARPSVPAYDLSREITIQGTVGKTVNVKGQGAPLGIHLMIETSQGLVDAHLRPVSTAGKLSFTAGQKVEVTGMMANFGGKQVLLARVIKTENFIILLRNEHGIPLAARSPRGAPLPRPAVPLPVEQGART